MNVFKPERDSAVKGSTRMRSRYVPNPYEEPDSFVIASRQSPGT
ncbi:hypothetical protein [Cohnella cholangitidis]|nr:hypothetical protein [Cohnella cholangitidis]